jgi:hypothetical protein
MRAYRYIGPKQIADRARSSPSGTPIHSGRDLLGWLVDTNQELDADGCVIATFVVNSDAILLVADRRSEHVACAAGQPVLSAGELTIQVENSEVSVTGISNQSTGYCPEPESWPTVVAALEAAGIEGPAGFTLSCVFRLCVKCGSKNLVKDGVYECGVCAAELPASYNCQ